MTTNPLPITIATYLYLLHRSGTVLNHDGIRGLCARIDAEGATTELGELLSNALETQLGDGSPEAVIPVLVGILGDAVNVDIAKGDTREARTSAVRRSLFGRSTPWLAWILERSPEGRLYPLCVLVEGFGENVQIMDPNPFNDIDEACTYEVAEFMARWELAGARSVGQRPLDLIQKAGHRMSRMASTVGRTSIQKLAAIQLLQTHTSQKLCGNDG